jgi:hypothetical protein
MPTALGPEAFPWPNRVSRWETEMVFVRYKKTSSLIGIGIACVLLVPLGWVIMGLGYKFHIVTPGILVMGRLPIVRSLEWETKLLICGIVNGICFFAMLCGWYLAVRRFRRTTKVGEGR